MNRHRPRKTKRSGPRGGAGIAARAAKRLDVGFEPDRGVRSPWRHRPYLGRGLVGGCLGGRFGLLGCVGGSCGVGGFGFFIFMESSCVMGVSLPGTMRVQRAVGYVAQLDFVPIPGSTIPAFQGDGGR